jgi:mannose-6-phosphate isomerase
MKEMPLSPLRFAPIYQYRLWGGRRLRNLLTAPLPGEEPIGEASGHDCLSRLQTREGPGD